MTSFVVILAGIVIAFTGILVGQFVARRATKLQKKLLEEQTRVEAQMASKWLSISEAMLASIGDGLIVTDTKSKIIYTNKAFENILGWESGEVLGKLVTKVVPREDEKGKQITSTKQNLSLMLSGKMPTTTATTTYFARKDKTKIPVSLIISPIVLNEKIIGAVESFRDITQEKKIDETKSEFVSLAAHQLRTPLTSINWHIEMLLDADAGKLNNKQKQYLDEIHNGNQRMVTLVNSLLDVSNIEAGTIAIDLRPVNLTVLLKEVITEVMPLITAKKLSVKEVSEPDLSRIDTDPKLTRIVFQNLITNAIHYSSDNAKIEVKLVHAQVGGGGAYKEYNRERESSI
ncbi:MAG: PAS domain-containing sensor histidine kinase [bacterium]|nr:PAS domain-containing sensor histidine kinase [bacterium]